LRVLSLNSVEIFELFEKYKQENDVVGMDMARKFIMMGWTRSRRYANHKTGRKYSTEDDSEKASKVTDEQITDMLEEKEGNFKDPRNRYHKVVTKTKKILPKDEDPIKAESARIFREVYEKVMNDSKYIEMRDEHIKNNEMIESAPNKPPAKKKKVR